MQKVISHFLKLRRIFIMLYIPFNRVSAIVKKRVQGQTSSSPRYPGLWECRSRPILSMRAKSIAGMMILKKKKIGNTKYKVQLKSHIKWLIKLLLHSLKAVFTRYLLLPWIYFWVMEFILCCCTYCASIGFNYKWI